jgi:hypothetical protein
MMLLRDAQGSVTLPCVRRVLPRSGDQEVSDWVRVRFPDTAGTVKLIVFFCGGCAAGTLRADEGRSMIMVLAAPLSPIIRMCWASAHSGMRIIAFIASILMSEQKRAAHGQVVEQLLTV